MGVKETTGLSTKTWCTFCGIEHGPAEWCTAYYFDGLGGDKMSYVGEICPYCGQQFDTGGQCGCMLRDRYSDPPAATFSFSTDSLGRIAAALERIADALEKQR